MAGFSFTALGTPRPPAPGRFGNQPLLKPPRPPRGLGTQFGSGPRQAGAGQRIIGAEGPGAAPPSFAAASGAPGQGTPGQAPGQGAGQGGGPYDSIYYGNVANNTANVNNAINAINLNDALAGSNLYAAMGQIAYAQPRADLKLEQGANSRGSLYSSVYSQNLGDLNKGFDDQRGGLLRGYGGKMSADASRIAALKGGIPLYNDAQAADAASRASAAAAKDPSSGLSQLLTALAGSPKGIGNLYGNGPSSAYHSGAGKVKPSGGPGRPVRLLQHPTLGKGRKG